MDDGVAREERDWTELDQGIKYKGEWSIELNTKDGKGIQIWPDGS